MEMAHCKRAASLAGLRLQPVLRTAEARRTMAVHHHPEVRKRCTLEPVPAAVANCHLEQLGSAVPAVTVERTPSAQVTAPRQRHGVILHPLCQIGH
jgi:hypothetical protein